MFEKELSKRGDAAAAFPASDDENNNNCISLKQAINKQKIEQYWRVCWEYSRR
jgi:hypothetical protein